MCVTKTSSSSNVILFKDFDKKNIVDKQNTTDNVIDLTDPSKLNTELAQETQDTMYLKVKDGQYLKIDLSTAENKTIFDKFKGKIISEDGTINQNFLKLADSQPTDISIEQLFKSVDIPLEDIESPVSALEQLGKNNRNVAELLKKIETNEGSGGSLKYMNISKQEIADYMVSGQPSENIAKAMELLNRTGEWSALNSMIELNTVRKAYLENKISSIDEKINLKNDELKQATDPAVTEQIQNDINNLTLDKKSASDEISDIVKKSQTLGSTAMKTRAGHSSREIARSERKLEKLTVQINESKKQIENLKSDPEKLKAEQKNLEKLEAKYKHVKDHMDTVSKDTIHDTKFMDKMISDREDKNIKVDKSMKRMASQVHTVAAKTNLTFARVATKESTGFNDEKTKEVDNNLKQTKEHIEKIENYNPEFKKPITKPTSDKPEDKKEYQEAINERDQLFDLKVDLSQNTRQIKTDLLAKSDIKNNNGVFEKKDNQQFSNEEKEAIKAYHSEGYDLIDTVNNQKSILTKEMDADKEIDNNLTSPEDKSQYTAKVDKILSYSDISTEIKDEQTNIIISDMKAKSATKSLNKELKTKSEEYKQTAPSEDPNVKTEFDLIVDERTANAEQLGKNFDELEKTQKDLKTVEEALKKSKDSILPNDGSFILEAKKEALEKTQTRLMRDIPRLKSIIADNNARISVLYNKHKELEDGSNRPSKTEDKGQQRVFERGSKLNKRIADNQKKLEEIDAKISNRATNLAFDIGLVPSGVKDAIKKERENLAKQIEKDKAAYTRLNLDNKIEEPKDGELPPNGSINAIKANIKNSEIEGTKFSANKELLQEVAEKKGKITYGFSLEDMGESLSKDIESQEKILSKDPEWAKNDKDYQTFKAKQYYKIADKRTDISPTLAYASTEPYKQDKVDGYRQKYINDKFQAELNGKDVKNFTPEKIENDAENSADKEVDDHRSAMKQIRDSQAVSSLDKAEEIVNKLKSDSQNPLTNEEIINLTKTSVRTGNKVASGIADIDAETSVKILKRSSENVDKLSSDYKLVDGTTIKTDDLKKEMHDKISETSAKSVDVALKRKMFFEGKYQVNNPDLIRSAAQDLLDLAVKEADTVKKLEEPKVKELIAKKQEEINKLKDNLAKVPESNQTERKKIQDEINSTQKTIDTVSKYGVVSKGAITAYSVKENYDELNKKAIEEAKEHLTKLKQEKSSTRYLYDYKIDHVKDKREDQTVFGFWANTFNPNGDYDTDNLDVSMDRISNKYSRQIAQVNSFINNYEHAVKNGRSLEFISALKENREAKEVYDNDTTVTREDKFPAVTLKNNEAYFNSLEQKNIAQEGIDKMRSSGSRQLLAKYGAFNDGTVGGIVNSQLDKTSYNQWDPTIESFIKKGGVSENNSIKSSEKDTQYYNRSLIAGGNQSDLAPVEKMDSKYTNRRITEMFGIDPHDLAINTGIDWLDDTVNGVGAFLDRPETLEMLAEIVVIEVATAGTGTLLALGSEIKNASNAVKLASKISEFEKAAEAANLARNGVTEARAALEAAKAGQQVGKAEKIIALEKEVANAEKALNFAKANEVKAFKEVEDATNVIKKLADKRVREIAKHAKIESSGFVKKSAYKGAEFIKQKAIETAINKTSVAVFGENSDMNKIVGILSGASKNNKLTSLNEFGAKVLKDFSNQIIQTSTTKLGTNIYAKAVYGTSVDKLTPKQQQEAELFGDLFTKATDAAAGFVAKKLNKEVTPQQHIVDNQMKFLFPGLDLKDKKMAAIHKEISSALDSLHSSEKLTPEKNMEKLEAFEAAVKKHYPDIESQHRVQEFIKNQTAKVIVRDLDKTNLLEYEKVLKEHFIEHNKNNPDKMFDAETVNRMTSQLVIQKAIEDVKPLNFESKDIETPQGKKDFEDHVGRKMKEINDNLSKVMPDKHQSGIVSNMTMKLYISELANEKNINPATKKYLEDLSNSLEVNVPKPSVKSDNTGNSTPSVQPALKPVLTDEQSKAKTQESVKSFDSNLEKNPQAYKAISESLDDYHKIAGSDPDKAREKLDEFKSKIEKHYPEDKKSPEKVKAYEFIQEELVKLSLGEMKPQPNQDPLEYARDIKMQLDNYNAKNPNRTIEHSFIEKAYENAISGKAFEGVNKIDSTGIKLDTSEGKKDFEAKIKTSKDALVNKLSQTMRKDVAEYVADRAIKTNLEDISKNISSGDKKYLDNIIKNQNNKTQANLLLEDNHETVAPHPLKSDLSADHYKELEKFDVSSKLVDSYKNVPTASQVAIAQKIKSVLDNNSISKPDKEKFLNEIAEASRAYADKFTEIKTNQSILINETNNLKKKNEEIENKLVKPNLSETDKEQLNKQLNDNNEIIDKNLKTLVNMKTTNRSWTEEKRLYEIIDIAEEIYTKKNFNSPEKFTGITKKVNDELPNIKGKDGQPVFKNIQEFHLATRKFPSELSLDERDAIKQIREKVSAIPPNGKKIIKVEMGGIYERGDRDKIGGFVVEPEFLKNAKNKEDVIINLLRLDYPGSPYLDDNGKLKKGVDIKIYVAKVEDKDIKNAYSKEYEDDGIDILANQYPFGGGAFALSYGEDQVGTPEYKIKDNATIVPEKVFRSFDEFKTALDNEDAVFKVE